MNLDSSHVLHTKQPCALTLNTQSNKLLFIHQPSDLIPAWRLHPLLLHISTHQELNSCPLKHSFWVGGMTYACLCVPLLDRTPHHLLSSPQLLHSENVCVSVFPCSREVKSVCGHANTCITTLMWMLWLCWCIILLTAVHFSHFSDTQMAVLSLCSIVNLSCFPLSAPVSTNAIYNQALFKVSLPANSRKRPRHNTETCSQIHENMRSFWKQRCKHLSGSGVFLRSNQRVVGRRTMETSVGATVVTLHRDDAF